MAENLLKSRFRYLVDCLAKVKPSRRIGMNWNREYDDPFSISAHLSNILRANDFFH